MAIWIAKLRPDDRCLLIDGDMHVRTIELKMCSAHDVTLKDVLSGDKPWQDAVYTCELERGGELMYPKLAVLPAGGRFLPPMRGNPLVYLDITKKIFGQMIEGLRKKFKHIIIDTPASVSLEHLVLTASADAVVYVCEPNDDSINSTLATSGELKDFMEVQALGVVLSRVPDGIDAKRWITQAEKIASVLGVVPEDPKVGEAFRANLPVVAAYPESPASSAIGKITRKILGAKIRRTEMVQKVDRGFLKVMERVKKEAEE